MRVKLKIAIVIMFVVTTFGCSKEPTDPVHPYEPSDEAISFDAYNFEDEVTDPNTRGIIKKEFQDEDSFGVLGYYLSDGVWNSTTTNPVTNETPNFMYNQQVTLNSNAWSYSPIKYWPNDPAQKIKFFAYHPHNRNNPEKSGITLSGNNAIGYPTIEFTPKESVSTQVDFVTAQTGLLAKNSGGIPLEFEHQLSQVTFSANHNGLATDKVMIIKIVLEGTKICKIGAFTTDGFAWSSDFHSSSPIYTITKENYELISNDQDYLPKAENTNHKLISTTKGILLLHPQSFTALKNIEMFVVFSVKSEGQDLIVSSKKIKANTEYSYVKGKRTNYTLTIDVNNNIDVGIADVAIEDWIVGGSLTGDDGVIVE